MGRKVKLTDARTGRKVVVYMQPVHKPPAARRKHKPMVVYGDRNRPPVEQPIYQHPDFYPYQRHIRGSKAVSWAIGLVGFFGSFAACEISPVLTIAGWGLTLAILVYRSVKDQEVCLGYVPEAVPQPAGEEEDGVRPPHAGARRDRRSPRRLGWRGSRIPAFVRRRAFH